MTAAYILLALLMGLILGYALAHFRAAAQIERAKSVGDLLPHLYPLVDAILERVGSEAAAEFADTAAFILHPLERDGLLN